MTTAVYAGVELGGTKTICTVATDTDTIVDSVRIPTTTPAETLAKVVGFLEAYSIKALGIASFGPINIDPDSQQFGVLETTPKPYWQGVSLVSYLQQYIDCPVAIDSDVSAAALAEQQMGAAKDLYNMVYVTVGTGIGAGAVIAGETLRGMSHPEMGHLALRRHASDLTFESTCPYHPHCAEGLASGTAIKMRWGLALNEVPETHPAWALQAHYLAQLAHTLTVFYSPQRIVFGGGVSSEPLLTLLRDELHSMLNGYVAALPDRCALDSYICLPKLGGNAGPMGSLLLAIQAEKSGYQLGRTQQPNPEFI